MKTTMFTYVYLCTILNPNGITPFFEIVFIPMQYDPSNKGQISKFSERFN